jgi:thiol-disulfide isomerase/thioredoxin
MNKTLLALIGGLVVIGVLFAYHSGEKDMMMEKNTDTEQMMTEEAMDKDMIETEDTEVSKDSMMEPGTYQAYSPEKLMMAEEGKVVLFFKASWCPTCRALDADLKAKAAMIPSDVTILEVNYDASTDLKKKYGVTNQHTLVQVDAEGDQITKWSGGLTLATVIEKLK